MIKFIRRNLCLILVGIILIFILILHVIADDVLKYVAGKYGGKCYIEGNSPANIKYLQEFNNYQDCLNYLGKNQNE